MRTCRLLAAFCLLALGCADTPESKVDKAGAELTRALANIDKIGSELAKAEKALAAQKSHYEELKAKLNGLKPTPNPQPPTPTPNPAPSPVPTPTPPGPLPPVPSPSPTPTEPADGRFALAKRIYHETLVIKTEDLSGEAATLAGNIGEVIELIKAGKTDSMLLSKQAYNISVELTKRNKPFTTAHPAWLPPAAKLGEAIEELLNSDKIKNNRDWIDALDEVLRALQAVSKAVK